MTKKRVVKAFVLHIGVLLKIWLQRVNKKCNSSSCTTKELIEFYSLVGKRICKYRKPFHFRVLKIPKYRLTVVILTLCSDAVSGTLSSPWFFSAGNNSASKNRGVFKTVYLQTVKLLWWISLVALKSLILRGGSSQKMLLSCMRRCWSKYSGVCVQESSKIEKRTKSS